MRKPDNYDQIEAANFGEYTRPPEGYYIFEVYAARDAVSQAGNDMLELHLDIAEGNYANHFSKHPVKYYQLTGDKSLSYFKGLMKAFEESNNGFKIAFDQSNNFDTQKFCNKLVGGYLKDDQRDGKVYSKVKFLCSVATARAHIEIKANETINFNTSASSSIPLDQPAPKDDDIPF